MSSPIVRINHKQVHITITQLKNNGLIIQMNSKEKECVARLRQESDIILQRFSVVYEREKYNERLNGWEEQNTGITIERDYSLPCKKKKKKHSNFYRFRPDTELKNRFSPKVNENTLNVKPALLQFSSTKGKYKEADNYSSCFVDKFKRKVKIQKIVYSKKISSGVLQDSMCRNIKINSILSEKPLKVVRTPTFLLTNSRIVMRKNTFIENLLKLDKC